MTALPAGPWTSPTDPVPVVAALTETVGDAAIYLMVGGLVILIAVVGIVLARSVFPVRESSTAALEAGRAESMRPTPDLDDAEPGQRVDAAEPPAFASLDEGLAWFEENGFGRPRVLGIDEAAARVRVYACSECVDGGRRCDQQTDRIAAAFAAGGGSRPSVREVACRADGAAACEFEVTTT